MERRGRNCILRRPVFIRSTGVRTTFICWRTRLCPKAFWRRSAVAQHRALSELAGIGARKIGCRLLINDKNLVLLADSRYYNAGEGERFDYQGQFLPDEIVRTIDLDFSQKKLQKQGFYAGQDGRYGGSLIYCRNLYIGERYEGTCSIMEDGRSFRESDLALFQHFFQYADELFVFYHGTRGKHSRALRMVMEDLLKGKQINGQLQLEAEGYRKDFENYRCLVLRSASQRMLPYDYLCLALESSCDGCISLLFEESVVGFLPRFEPSQAAGLQQRSWKAVCYPHGPRGSQPFALLQKRRAPGGDQKALRRGRS